MADPDDLMPDVPVPVAHVAAIGSVANAWANLEFAVDLGIWELMRPLPQMIAACVTSQFMTIHARLNAYRALVSIRGASGKDLAAIGKFQADIGTLVERRNRAVHDPRMVEATTGIVKHLQITGKGKLKFGFQPESAESLLATEEEIKKHIRGFRRLRERIEKTLEELPEEQLPKLHKIQQLRQARGASTK